MLDETDFKILSLLIENSRLQWREIGEIVHLTGQAVSNRICKMQKLGIIEGYTIKINNKKLGNTVTAFITVFMKNTDHIHFQKFIKENKLVKEAHRISGDGCYILKVIASNQEEINKLLDCILKYGNYRINLSIEHII